MERIDANAPPAQLGGVLMSIAFSARAWSLLAADWMSGRRFLLGYAGGPLIQLSKELLKHANHSLVAIIKVLCKSLKAASRFLRGRLCRRCVFTVEHPPRNC